MTGPFIGGWETNAADVGRWTPAQDWYIDADTLGLVDVLVGGREISRIGPEPVNTYRRGSARRDAAVRPGYRRDQVDGRAVIRTVARIVCPHPDATVVVDHVLYVPGHEPAYTSGDAEHGHAIFSGRSLSSWRSAASTS